ncbi:hypothetical protein AGLY_012916 [Aphis glycines]|uniref:Uncharacterized protein n=1 Tax=Aphis glycines TaxID=307491 RepID=A0A6G0T9D5_APHGL|nr:hypothetical protein AGLY_012916 [Aphis glycines]
MQTMNHLWSKGLSAGARGISKRRVQSPQDAHEKSLMHFEDTFGIFPNICADKRGGKTAHATHYLFNLLNHVGGFQGIKLQNVRNIYVFITKNKMYQQLDFQILITKESITSLFGEETYTQCVNYISIAYYYQTHKLKNAPLNKKYSLKKAIFIKYYCGGFLKSSTGMGSCNFTNKHQKSYAFSPKSPSLKMKKGDSHIAKLLFHYFVVLYRTYYTKIIKKRKIEREGERRHRPKPAKRDKGVGKVLSFNYICAGKAASRGNENRILGHKLYRVFPGNFDPEHEHTHTRVALNFKMISHNKINIFVIFKQLGKTKKKKVKKKLDFLRKNIRKKSKILKIHKNVFIYKKLKKKLNTKFSIIFFSNSYRENSKHRNLITEVNNMIYYYYCMYSERIRTWNKKEQKYIRIESPICRQFGSVNTMLSRSEFCEHTMIILPTISCVLAKDFSFHRQSIRRESFTHIHTKFCRPRRIWMLKLISMRTIVCEN